MKMMKVNLYVLYGSNAELPDVPRIPVCFVVPAFMSESCQVGEKAVYLSWVVRERKWFPGFFYI